MILEKIQSTPSSFFGIMNPTLIFLITRTANPTAFVKIKYQIQRLFLRIKLNLFNRPGIIKTQCTVLPNSPTKGKQLFYRLKFFSSIFVAKIIKHPVASSGVLTALLQSACIQSVFAPREEELNSKRLKVLCI